MPIFFTSVAAEVALKKGCGRAHLQRNKPVHRFMFCCNSIFVDVKTLSPKFLYSKTMKNIIKKVGMAFV